MRVRTSTFTISLTLLCLAGVGSSGCDKNKPPPDDPSTTSAGTGASDTADSGEVDGGEGEEGEDSGEGEGGEDSAGEPSWASMDREARLTYMGTTVMPTMKEHFKQRGFDTFKCANCHGNDYKEVDFKMPNDLTPLNPDNPIQSGMDLDEEMTKFMVSTVLPEMAKMLGKQTDVTTGKGEFGCLSCHLSE
jgi:hypothetical protein